MSMQVTLPDDVADLVSRRAATMGSTPEDVAVSAIRSSLSQAAMAELDEVLRPIRKAFDASGMTEDELSDLLEEEKHAMRRGE
ncbi:MAG: hypothetical protein RH917_03810 [Lacipirellulaceae bacterium]